ncbi:MAG: hypothetical protein PHI38_03180 [Sulfurimonas sp.]|uniref:hypothetical protein n=1 Tax=Sulfurimonas sp. TaxID=2022749 RepID=UPI0026243062|nr:hypothetical protein [Sulfurimonas sp.]MDD3475847.1 hypothetical protein [Sulfurimonas sp.]
MRSRDGDCNFTLRLCSIIVLYSLSLSASEYLISYRYIVKDATLYNETLLVSKSMKKCNGNPYSELFLYTNSQDDLKKIISQNSTEFIDYIHKLGLHVEHKETTTNLQNSSTTTLTLRTTCFKVDINDTLAKITPLR